MRLANNTNINNKIYLNFSKAVLENVITTECISYYTTFAFYPEDGNRSFLRNFGIYLTTWRHIP